MSVDISIVALIDDAEEFFGELGDRNTKIALSLGVKRTGRQATAKSATLIAKAMGLKTGIVREKLRLRLPRNLDDLSATITGRGNAMSLIHFGAKQRRKGVSAKAWGERRTYPHTFIARANGGGDQVFARKGSDRLPIRKLFGPGIAQTMADAEVFAAIEDHAEERLETNIAREIDRRLRKVRGKAR